MLPFVGRNRDRSIRRSFWAFLYKDIAMPWQNPSERPAMVAAKERFLGLEKEIAAKGDWSHEEEDAIRDTIEDLEKDFAIYLVEASQPCIERIAFCFA